MNTDRWPAIREEFDRVGTTEDGVMLRLCLHVVVYYEGLFAEQAPQLLRLYEAALPHVREHLTFYDVDGRFRPKKIGPRAFELLPFWAGEVDEQRLRYGLMLESGSTRAEHGEHAFHLYQLGTVLPGFVRLVLPIDTVATDPQALVELAASLVGDLRFSCGSAGFCVSHYGFSDDAGVRALSRRYKGVDFCDPYAFRTWINEGISGVNWLTFVGDGLLERIGDTVDASAVEVLRDRLGPDNPIHELDHGVMVQAGPAPGLGEVNRGDLLPHYHRVGQALAGLRIPSDAMGRSDDIGGDEEHTQAWLARFDEALT